MKHIITLIFTVFVCTVLARAQNDTLIWENFDVDPTAGYDSIPSGTTNETKWTNFDQDRIPADNMRPGDWYWTTGTATLDTADRVLSSTSWLEDFVDGNRNWLITPAIVLTDTNGMLSWSSAPFRFPLYCDSYTVLVSSTDNAETSFTDTLYQQGGYISGSGADLANYVFSPGDLHGGGMPPGPYFEFLSDSSQWLCVQEPHSVSLAQYAGMTIYIAFLHDSDDDNQISLDDILVTGTQGGVGFAENTAELTLSIFPNPVADVINMNYYLPQTSTVAIYIYDVAGKKVKEFIRGMHIKGMHNFMMDVSDLMGGQYLISISTGTEIRTEQFIIN